MVHCSQLVYSDNKAHVHSCYIENNDWKLVHNFYVSSFLIAMPMVFVTMSVNRKLHSRGGFGSPPRWEGTIVVSEQKKASFIILLL